MGGSRVRAAMGVVTALALGGCASGPTAAPPATSGVPATSATAPASGTAPRPPGTGTGAAPPGVPGSAPPRTAAPRPVPTGPPQPWGEGGAQMVRFADLGFPSYGIGSVAADPAGQLWLDAGTVTQRCLVHVDPASTELTAEVRPLGQVATGDDGSVWYTTDRGVVRQAADGTSETYDLEAAVGSETVVHPLTVDPQGRAWVSLTDSDAIARVDPQTRATSGGVDRFSAGIPSAASPGSIDAAADGTIWFAEPDVHQVGRATADGRIDQLTVGGAPEVVVAAPDGGAWFFDRSDQSFGRIDAQGSVSRVRDATPSAPVTDLTVAPDGSVWYVADPGIVGRFGDGLALQELPIVDRAGSTVGASFHHPKAITVDPEGTIWFTDLFYGGEGSTIGLYAVAAGARPGSWPDDLPVDRPIGTTLTTCGDG